jgi:NADPH-dependent 2,4-dienoyl-CoA reductase/sulfur reductase-like enzyme
MSEAVPDLLIVGAGPAGIGAAIEARQHGLSVLVLDENAAPGGRIWQALESRAPLDDDEAAARHLLRAFRAGGADARWRAGVWAIEPDGQVFWSENGHARSAQPGHIMLATGTTERPLPVPGWTLPGVMTVGAAQIALKTGGLLPTGATWLAGQGPLLMLYAVQALRAGGRIAGILDLSDGFAPLRALRHVPGALRRYVDISKGLAWRRAIAAAGVPWIGGSDLRAEGGDRLARISFRAGGRTQTRAADLLLLHDGVMPSLALSSAVGCAHEWDAAQRCWKPVVDRWGQSSVPGIGVAGDGAGVAGAQAAVLSGRIAALAVAHARGRIDATTRDTAAAPLRAALARHRATRPLLDTLYAPRAWAVDDATIVCRCESVTAGDLRAAAALGAGGLNQAKAFTRCGMGPCQGRVCGGIAADVLAAARGVPPAAVEPVRVRFPTRPLTVGMLAKIDTETT